ncbi:MAG: sigma-54 interaction domain-containing protein [Desulfosoma sp.]|uniref:sigma-54 interaction domain-containing protein n=1 Tax=Desulfosoma sp. TaxID=2603217 RepID=UPI00404928DE
MTEPQIIGISPSIEKIRHLIRRVADVNLTVLITGESGVGKELVARALHYYSSRRDKPFVKVNCAALPGELIESELFGYEKGAFTGADRRKPGKFEAAGEGTIFLDEIGEIPLPMQAKLLQVLQDQKFHRVGGNTEVATSARIIAATNRNLEAEIAVGHFREDLYFRINTISILVPPLRDRKEDLTPLIKYFLKTHQALHNNHPPVIPPSLFELFQAYHWPGNVRELENYLKRLAVLGDPSEIEKELRGLVASNAKPNSAPLSTLTRDIFQEIDLTSVVFDHRTKDFPSLREVREQAVLRVEKAIIEHVLEETRWNRREAARLLKISYRTLLYKLKEMNIRPDDS